MARPDRLEDLGRIAAIVEQIYDAELFAPMDLSEDDFITIYSNPRELEVLHTTLNKLARKIERIDEILIGRQE